MKVKAGFSLVEVLILLLISSILILSSYPMFTKKKVNEAKNTNTIQCIEKESAASLTTQACTAAVNGVLFNMANYLDTLMTYVDSANPTISNNGLKVLKEACDKGGKLACDKIIHRCANDSSKCRIAGNEYDLEYYLRLLFADSNLSKSYIKSVLTPYYNVNMINIKNEVDYWCCNPDVNLACDIKSISACPWKQLRLDSSDQKGDSGRAIAVDGSGNIYIAGNSKNTSNVDHISVLKLNSSGTIVWETRLATIYADTVNDITVDASGFIYIVGSSTFSSGQQIAVIKMNNDGTITAPGWAKKYKATNNLANSGNGIAVKSDGTIYVVGSSTTASNSDIVVLNLNADGTKRYWFRFDSGTHDWGNAIALDPANYVYITGSVYVSGPTQDLVMMRLDGNLGFSSANKYDVEFTEGYQGNDIVIDSSSNIYITGTINWGWQMYDIIAMKMNTSGTISWARDISATYAGGAELAEEYGTGIAIDEVNQNLYITGNIIQDASSYDMTVIKLNFTNGIPVWAKRLNAADNIDDNGTKIAVDNNYIYVTGNTKHSSRYNMVLLKMNKTQVNDSGFGSYDFKTEITSIPTTFTPNDPAYTVTTPFVVSDPNYTIDNPGYTFD